MFNGNNLPHELLLTIRQTTKLSNAIKNNLQTDINLSKAQISKIIQSGGFLGKILGPLLKTGLPLVKSVIKPLGLLLQNHLFLQQLMLAFKKRYMEVEQQH